MSRLPSIRIQPDGLVEVRVTIEKDLWDMLSSVGSRFDRMTRGRISMAPGLFGVQLLLERLADLVRTGNVRALPGTEWQLALQDVQEASAKADTSELGLPSDFDRSLLHLSPDKKSTYYGVIRYGTGFKVRARRPSGIGEIEVGNGFKVAELGALARYYHYLNNESLCYGAAEEAINYFRSKHMESGDGALNDAELWPKVVQQLQDSGLYEQVLGRDKGPRFLPGPRAPQLEAHRSGALVIDAPEVEISPRQVGERLEDFRKRIAESRELGTLVVATPAPTTSAPTWAGLTTAFEAPFPVEEPPKQRGRPRVHFQNGVDSCACGRDWPCPRRQKSDD